MPLATARSGNFCSMVLYTGSAARRSSQRGVSAMQAQSPMQHVLSQDLQCACLCRPEGELKVCLTDRMAPLSEINARTGV